MHFVNNVVSADTGNVFFTSFLTLPRYVWRSPDFGCTNESDDAASAYLQSLLWCITGQEQYADHAIAVLNAYAYGLDEYNNSNAPLQAGWSLMQFSKAAELLTHGRGLQASRYDEKDRAALVEMLHRTTVPLIIDGSGANGNWELSMLDGLIGLAVFSDNTTLFQHTIDLWKQRLPSYFYVEALDGSSPVPPPRGHPTWYDQKVFNASIDGHCQETCRDLGHTQMGFASAIDCATEPPRPRCPAQQGGRCAELWAVVNAWEAACQPAEPVDCSQEVFPPKCPPGSSTTCDEGWAATNAWRAACRPDAP